MTRSFHLPTLGAISGVGLGIMIRLYNGIPSDFKLDSKMVTPLCSQLNSVMQIIFKGPWQYIIMFAPLICKISCAGYKNYKQKSLDPLKKQLYSYETILSVSMLTLTLFLTFTHSYWIPILTQIGLNLGDLSEHVLAVFTFAAVLSAGLCSLIPKTGSFQKTALSCIFLLFSAASCLFLLNTTLYFHTIIETTSALVLALASFALSDLIAKQRSSTQE